MSYTYDEYKHHVGKLRERKANKGPLGALSTSDATMMHKSADYIEALLKERETLRDKLAGQALMGILARGSFDLDRSNAHKDMCKESYMLADTMLCVRGE